MRKLYTDILTLIMNFGNWQKFEVWNWQIVKTISKIHATCGFKSKLICQIANLCGKSES